MNSVVRLRKCFLTNELLIALASSDSALINILSKVLSYVTLNLCFDWRLRKELKFYSLKYYYLLYSFPFTFLFYLNFNMFSYSFSKCRTFGNLFNVYNKPKLKNKKCLLLRTVDSLLPKLSL